MNKQKVVLAYSGGLDTSVMIPWLKEHYNCDVIAMCANLGQADELEGLEEKALKTGALKVYVEDLRDVFITDYIIYVFNKFFWCLDYISHAKRFYICIN